MSKPLVVILIICLILTSACNSINQALSTTPTTIPANLGQTTQASPNPTTAPTGELEVHFIDVGQGDAILIDLLDTEILIDGGDRTPGVITYLEQYVDGPIEIMVATHSHADHIGGLIDVLAKYQVREIWLNGDTATSTTFTNFMNSVNSEGAIVHRAERGNVIQISTLRLNVLNPQKTLFSDANNNSIVLSLSYGNVDFLFTGDAEHDAEASMLVQSIVPLPDVEILKVGHHGSRTASSSAFLNTIKPDIAIYSAGAGNIYGHPHTETITALNAIGTRIYGTDVNGTIIVTSNGQTYLVNTERQ